MFEPNDLPATDEIAELDNSGLVDVKVSAARLERAAAARRLFAIGELFLTGRRRHSRSSCAAGI
jgi:hypothetical protein